MQLLAAEDSTCGFSDIDERFVFTAVGLLSAIVSGHYNSMLGDWTTRMYDPSPLARDATYCPELDQRSSEKSVDDFPALPMLVYRGAHPEPTAAPRTLVQTGAMKNEILHNAAPSTPVDCMRDVYRYTKSIEQNWGTAVNTQAALERKLESLGTQLEAARQGLGASPRDAPRGSVSHLDSPRRTTLTAVEVEDLHEATLARMRLTKGTTFLTDQGLTSTPRLRLDSA